MQKLLHVFLSLSLSFLLKSPLAFFSPRETTNESFLLFFLSKERRKKKEKKKYLENKILKKFLISLFSSSFHIVICFRNQKRERKKGLTRRIRRARYRRAPEGYRILCAFLLTRKRIESEREKTKRERERYGRRDREKKKKKRERREREREKRQTP